ncbi:MAG: ribosome silencing factor [Verrucomicrobiae bacterium]|nr:ribosome silencing factor [Verrucomicrobiae bacterium]
MNEPPSESLALARLCRELVLEKKAEDVVVLDMRGISSFCDFFVICNGLSEPHLKAIAGNVDLRLKEMGRRARGRDGAYSSHWLVIDYDDVIIHIFRADVRARYGLERLWGDAKRVE